MLIGSMDSSYSLAIVKRQLLKLSADIYVDCLRIMSAAFSATIITGPHWYCRKSQWGRLRHQLL